MPKSARKCLSLDKAVWERLHRVCDQTNRPLTDQILHWITEYEKTHAQSHHVGSTLGASDGKKGLYTADG